MVILWRFNWGKYRTIGKTYGKKKHPAMPNIGQVKTIRENIFLGDTELFLEKKEDTQSEP